MRPTNNYDSEFCGSVPIHLTNLIQPYGVLLIIDPSSWEIIQASENTEAVFSMPVNEVVNTTLDHYVDEKSLETLRHKLTKGHIGTIPATWNIQGKNFLVLVHPREDMLLAEIDMSGRVAGEQDSFVDVYQELKFTISSVEAAKTIEEACVVAAKELKRISGFDKVMIYSFDADWNGTVIAEEKEADMEPYFGFTFPASDIPKQARHLYLKNPYRFIPDRDYHPVKMFPVVNPVTGAFVDLSDCNLRSVAAVHIEYLKNMGVTASMSTRILNEGSLWGLIACHHKTPKYPTYEMCSIFEMLSGIISARIASLKREATHLTQTHTQSTYADLVEMVYKTQDVEKSLFSDKLILKLFSATGAVLAQKGNFATLGETPQHDQLEELMLWLHTRQFKNAYSTASLGSEYEYAGEYASSASGMMVVPVNHSKDHYLVVFRPEKIRVINWGGNPDERIRFDENEKNYHPRNSFKQWQQKVRGISQPWKKEEVEIAETLRSFLYEFETSVIL